MTQGYYLLIDSQRKAIGDLTPIGVPLESSLTELKQKVIETRNQKTSGLVGADPGDLVVWLLRGRLGDPAQYVEEKLKEIDWSDHRNNPSLEPLHPAALLKDLDLQPGHILLLELCVPVPPVIESGPGPRTKPNTQRRPDPSYEDIFIDVAGWDVFLESDLTRNHIVLASENQVPGIVRDLFKLQDRRPFPQDSATGWSTRYPKLEDYFGDLTTQSQTGTLRRRADFFEVEHLGLLAHRPWGALWDGPGKSFKGHSARSTLFDMLFLHSEETIKGVTLDSPWGFDLVMRCTSDAENPIRKYRPCSDLVISNGTLPQLLGQVNVNWTEGETFPGDKIRMLLEGAAVVRFANKFLRQSSARRDFILYAMFFWGNGQVSRYALFEPPDIMAKSKTKPKQIFYHERTFNLNQPNGRLDVACQLYNALHTPRPHTNDTANKIKELQVFCDSLERPSHPDHPNPPVKSNNPTRKSANDGNYRRADPGGSRECTILKEQGYEVELHVGIDDIGTTCQRQRFDEDLPHIFTVYRASNLNEALIAKKVPEESNEREILEFLDTIHPKSEHVISLVDSFHMQSTSWVILPKLSSLTNFLDFSPEKLSGKATQLCHGLIDGLAYLHEHCVAHRDIKPDNLLVDQNHCMKIIDFDISMKVRDENEEVSDRSGTERWTAPEIERWLMYSPIKADRWSCGHVLQHILHKLQKRDEFLLGIAENLKAQDPNERPSLLKLRNSVAITSFDMTNLTPEATKRGVRMGFPHLTIRETIILSKLNELGGAELNAKRPNVQNIHLPIL